MAQGLDGIFKDYDNDVSFNEVGDFYAHLQSRGKIEVVGSIRCSQCGTQQENFRGQANIDPVTGEGKIICEDCKAAIIKEAGKA